MTDLPKLGLLWQVLPGLCLSAAITLVSHAQTPTVDDFNPALNCPAFALAVQADGKILVGGTLNTVGYQSLGRFNPDGTVDATFSAQVDDFVYALAVQADGRILVGGDFWSLGGGGYSCLGRLEADGSLDTTFYTYPSGSIKCIALQADGKILVGGTFSSVLGQTRNRIARLNADGTLDPGFYSGAGPNAGGWLDALALQADGRILVGGGFTSLNGQARVNLGRLNANGTLDTGFNAAAGDANSEVLCLALQADGRILVGGWFTTLGGQPRPYLGRLNANGSVDMGFDPGADSSVHSLAVQADGRIVVAGAFSSSGGGPPFLTRLNGNGSVDNGFNPGANDVAYSLAVQADGKVLVGGNFTILGGQQRRCLARLNSTGSATNSLAFDGSSVTWWRGGASPEIFGTTFEACSNGTDWTSLGAATRISGGWQKTGLALPTNATVRARGLAAGGYNNGSGWWVEASLGAPVISAQPHSRTNNAATRAAFSVVAAGSPPLGCQWWRDGAALADAGNVSGAGTSLLVLTSVLRADAGRYWAVLTNSSGNTTSAVATLTVVDPAINTQPASHTYRAESTAEFSVAAAGTSPLSYRWRKNGVDLADGGAVSGAATAALRLSGVLYPDGGAYSVVVSNAWGMLTSAVATLTVTDPAIVRQPVNSGANLGGTAVLSVTAAGTRPLSYQWYRGGTNLAGATAATLTLTNFQSTDAGPYRVLVTNMWGSVTSSVAVLIVSLADPFNPGAPGGYVESLAVQPDGKILAGGLFTVFGGQSRTYAGRVNADGTPDMTFNPRPNNCVNCLAVQGDGGIFLGGLFSSLCGGSRGGIGRLNADGTLDARFAPNTSYYHLSCLAVQPDGKVLLGGTLGSLVRLNANGTRDGSFSAPVGGSLICMALQQDGKIVVGGKFSTLAGQSRVNLGRFNPNGTLDTNFNASTSGQISSEWEAGVLTLAVLPSGKILVGGNFSLLCQRAHAGLGCLNPDGTMDTNFTAYANDIVHTFALQADGGILVGGRFSALRNAATWQTLNGVGRLTGDGIVDTNFTNPKAMGTVLALALEPDGRIVVGGTLTSLSSLARTNIGRLINTGPATEKLSFDGSAITWLRGGTAPEVWRTTFDYSADGTNWNSLGAGTRIAGGWQLGPVSVPATGTLRARGFVTGGHYNASGSLVETLASFSPPLILTQPLSRTNNVGTAAVFSTEAGGTPPLSYQWRFNGTDLPGATDSTMTLAAVQEADQGLYSVVVSNAFGWVASADAALEVNQAPIADASATQPVVVSANGTDATVVLNGTRSSDPDGDLLQYAWYAKGNPDPLAHGAVAVIVLPVGAHPIWLVVSDGMLTATNALTVEVITAAQAVERLIAGVESRWPRSRPLVATLSAALRSIERGNMVSAINQLQAFQNKVRAQVMPADAALAAGFIQSAQEIIDVLSGGATKPGGRLHGRFTSVAPQANGRIQLQLSAEPGRLHILEASTNLVDWEVIGLATEQADGSFVVEDPNAARLPNRFYRIVSP